MTQMKLGLAPNDNGANAQLVWGESMSWPTSRRASRHGSRDLSPSDTPVVVVTSIVTVCLVVGSLLAPVTAVASPEASVRATQQLLSSAATELSPRGGHGTFTPNSPGPAPTPVAERTDLRTATTSTWKNSDGSMSVRQYSTPKFFRTPASKILVPIDEPLMRSSVDEDGWWESGNGVLKFGPAGSVGGNERIMSSAGVVGFSPQGIRDAKQKPVVSKSEVRYPAMWPEVDVVESVLSSGVKEDLVLTSPGAQSRFTFMITGATTRVNDAGGLDVLQAGSQIGTIPAPTVAISTPLHPRLSGVGKKTVDATADSGAHIDEIEGGLTVSVSSAWLANLPASAYPVVIDPWFSYYGNGPDQSRSYSDTNVTQQNVVKVGTDSSGAHWSAAAYFSTPILPAVAPGTPPWTLGSATLQGSCTSTCALLGLSIRGETNAPNSPPTAGSIPSGQVLFSAYGSNGIGTSLTNWFVGKPGSWLGFSGNTDGPNSAPGTMATFNPLYMVFTYYDNLAPTTVTAPAVGAVVASVSPTLSAKPVTTTGGESVWYDFKLSTSSDGSGNVSDSGWLTQPTWVVPPGVLIDGATYFATILDTSWDPSFGTVGPNYVPPAAPLPPVQFSVKLRLDAGGPSPADTVGSASSNTTTPSEAAPSPGTPVSSESVDMLTGNIALSIGSHAAQALAGPAGVTLSYNSVKSSISAGSSYGLLGQYYLDANHTHSFPATLSGQRTDPGVNQAGSAGITPIGGIPQNTTGYMVRWTGQLALPAGSWNLGGVTSGGMRIFIDGGSTPAYNNWDGAASSTSPGYSTSTLQGGSSHKIEVDYWEAFSLPSFTTWIQFWVRNTATGGSAVIPPANWMTPKANGLPAGWSMSTNPFNQLWSRANDLSSQVILEGSIGQTAAFTRTSDGTYRAPTGDPDYLSRNGKGALQLSTPDGSLYVFGAAGNLVSLTTAADDLHPSALQYTYGGDPTVLQMISDPVSNRVVDLYYGGSPSCPSTNPAPSGLLCKVATWDGVFTGYGYNGNGQLAEVDAPGSQTTLFGYDADNRLIDIRDPLAFDFISSGQPGIPNTCVSSSTQCPLDTSVSYDSSNRVRTITSAAPAVGAVRPSRTYTYAVGQTSVLSAGEANAVTFTRRSTFDSQGRITSTATWGTNPSTFVWDAADHPIVKVDPAGIQTSTIYDSTGSVTDTYGPAPKQCFSGGWPADTIVPPTSSIPGYLPAVILVDGCSLTNVPHSQTGFDEGITGLAATYWSNSQFAGASVLHGRGANSNAYCALATTGDGVCMAWAGTTPVTPDASGGWSVRLTGVLKTPITGSYLFNLVSTQPASLIIDGIQLAKQPVAETGSQYVRNSATAQQPLTAGQHSIQIDFVGHSNSNNLVALYDNAAGQGLAISNTIIDPNYELATSTKDPDGKVIKTSYASPDGTIGAQFALPTVVTKDPTGLALAETATYEAPSSGTFLRRLSTTLPSGTTTTFTYYSGTGGPIAAACGVPISTPQGGKLATQTDPPAIPGGAARQQQFIYDLTGQEVGRRTGATNSINNQDWDCTTLDLRGRATTKSWAAFGSAMSRTSTYRYKVGGNPLVTSVSDTSAASAITSTVDLLGRVVKYISNGIATTTVFDQLGRVQSTTGPQGTVTNGYLDSGQLASVALDTGTGPMVLAQAMYSVPVGRLIGVSYSNDTFASFEYDPHGTHYRDNYWKNSTGDFLGGDIVQYSAGGRATVQLISTQPDTPLINPNPAGTLAEDYKYDGAGRLISAWLTSGLASYSYGVNSAADGCGNPNAGLNTNRTSTTMQPGNGATSTSTSTKSCFNDADQLTSTTFGSTAETRYSYDSRGNQTLDAGTALTWDSSNRLTVAAPPIGSSTQYAYDPLNRLTQETTGALTAKYVYGGMNDSAVAVLDGNNAVTQRFVALPGGVSLTLKSSALSQTWSYFDLHGHLALTADATASGAGIVYQLTYDPWGKVVNPQVAANGSATADYGAFGGAGKLTNTSTGIIIMGARPFNPAEGRFLSADRIAGGCANAYTYAHGDPLSQQDFNGNICASTAGWIGLGLGILSLGAGIAALFLTGPLAIVLGIGAAAFGVGAAILDISPCVQQHDGAACTGLGFGAVGAILGLGGGAAGAAGSELWGQALGLQGGLFGGTGTLVDGIAIAKATC